MRRQLLFSIGVATFIQTIASCVGNDTQYVPPAGGQDGSAATTTPDATTSDGSTGIGDPDAGIDAARCSNAFCDTPIPGAVCEDFNREGPQGGGWSLVDDVNEIRIEGNTCERSLFVSMGTTAAQTTRMIKTTVNNSRLVSARLDIRLPKLGLTSWTTGTTRTLMTLKSSNGSILVELGIDPEGNFISLRGGERARIPSIGADWTQVSWDVDLAGGGILKGNVGAASFQTGPWLGDPSVASGELTVELGLRGSAGAGEVEVLFDRVRVHN